MALDSSGVAVRGRLDEPRRQNLGAGRKDMYGSMGGKFQKAFCLGQFLGEGVSFREPFGAHDDHSRAILHLHTPDGAVRFAAKRVCHAQEGSQKKQRLPQRKLVSLKDLVIQAGQRTAVEPRDQCNQLNIVFVQPTGGVNLRIIR